MSVFDFLPINFFVLSPSVGGGLKVGQTSSLSGERVGASVYSNMNFSFWTGIF
jgi:hypothetical protein